jgi:hypothetical protein
MDTSRYTVAGSAELEQLIHRHVTSVTAEVVRAFGGDGPLGVFLGGGFGRGEGGVSFEAGVAKPYNDYDFFVVLRDAWPVTRRLQRRRATQLAAHLTERVGVEVELGVLHPRSLRCSPNSLMRCDLVHGARRSWGDVDLRAWMPPLAPSLVAPEEALYLLVNRGALLLMLGSLGGASAEAAAEDAPAPERWRRYVRKTELACGDAFLLSEQEWTPGAAARVERLWSAGAPAGVAQAAARALHERLTGDEERAWAGWRARKELARRQLIDMLCLTEARRLGVPTLTRSTYEGLARAERLGLHRGYGALAAQLWRLLSVSQPDAAACARFLAAWREAA